MQEQQVNGTGPRAISDDALAEAVRMLADGLRPDRIYLFGSRARGDWNEDSDYDLMVIVPASDEPPHQRAQQAYRLVADVPIAKDLHVWTKAEFEQQLPVVTSMPATVVREGHLLYAA